MREALLKQFYPPYCSESVDWGVSLGTFREIYSSEEIENIYACILAMQAHKTMPYELSFFMNEQSWLEANRVLDLGCGSGDILAELANYFPDKKYVGVDVDSKFIDIASKKYKRMSNIRFVCKDFVDLKNDGKYDYISSRALVQHLDNLDVYLTKVVDLLKPGGRLIIRDHNESLFKCQPDIPTLKTLLADFSKKQIASGKNRDAVFEVENMVGKYPLKVERAFDNVITTVHARDKRSFANRQMLVMKLLSTLFGVTVSEDKMYSDLKNWLETPSAYAQEGIHFLLIHCNK